MTYCHPCQFTMVSPVPNFKTGFKHPPGRSGHCAQSDGANMYVYGGYNPVAGPLLSEDVIDELQNSMYAVHHFKRQAMAELWKFNYATRIWARMCSENIHPTAASACAVLVSRSLFVYGGTIIPWGRVMSCTLSRYDLETNTWETVPTKGDTPPRGYGQSMLLHDDHLYVFTGAIAYIGDPVAELHRLSLHTLCWEKLNPEGETPKGRYKQEVLKSKDRFYLIGGGHEWEAACLEAIHIYWFEANRWESISCMPDDVFGSPEPRASLGCKLLKDQIYIFGGRYYGPAGESALNDIWRISIHTWKWQKLPTSLPTGLYFHTVCLAPSGHIYVYGGIDPANCRNSSVYRMRLFLPRLSDICWEKILSHVPPDKMHLLAQLGIPPNYLSRLQ